MRAGFRQQAQPSKKDMLRSLQTEVANLQMAGRISQMMTQQLLQNTKNIGEDLGRAMSLISELQYKLLAVQKVSNLDIAALGVVADELRLKDFEEASNNEDTKDGFTNADVVGPDSTVILTSTTENGQGIFRSRIKLAECGVPDLIKGLDGKAVGEKVEVSLNSVQHTVELLGIRNPQPQAPIDVTPVTPEVVAPTVQ